MVSFFILLICYLISSCSSKGITKGQHLKNHVNIDEINYQNKKAGSAEEEDEKEENKELINITNNEVFGFWGFNSKKNNNLNYSSKIKIDKKQIKTSYILPNEYYDDNYKKMIEEEAPEGTLISVGTERAFTILGNNLNFDSAILIDYNIGANIYNCFNIIYLILAKNIKEYKKYKSYTSKNKLEEEIKNIESKDNRYIKLKITDIKIFINNYADQYFSLLKKIKKNDLLTDQIFHNSEKKVLKYYYADEEKIFKYVKHLAMNNKIYILNVDLTKEKSWKQLNQFILKNKLKISTIDLSNINKCKNFGTVKHKILKFINQLSNTTQNSILVSTSWKGSMSRRVPFVRGMLRRLVRPEIINVKMIKEIFENIDNEKDDEDNNEYNKYIEDNSDIACEKICKFLEIAKNIENPNLIRGIKYEKKQKQTFIPKYLMNSKFISKEAKKNLNIANDKKKYVYLNRDHLIKLKKLEYNIFYLDLYKYENQIILKAIPRIRGVDKKSFLFEKPIDFKKEIKIDSQNKLTKEKIADILSNIENQIKSDLKISKINTQKLKIKFIYLENGKEVNIENLTQQYNNTTISHS